MIYNKIIVKFHNKIKLICFIRTPGLTGIRKRDFLPKIAPKKLLLPWCVCDPNYFIYSLNNNENSFLEVLSSANNFIYFICVMIYYYNL